MDEVTEIMEFIQRGTGIQTDIIWGNGYDNSLGESLSVTIVATGLSTEIGIGDLSPEPEPEELSQEEDSEPERLMLVDDENESKEEENDNGAEDIPFEVSGGEHLLETEKVDNNHYVLEDIEEEEDLSSVPERKKRGWVQSTIGGLFDSKNKNQ